MYHYLYYCGLYCLMYVRKRMGVCNSVVCSLAACWWHPEETKSGLAAISPRRRVRPQPDERCYHSRQEGTHPARWLLFTAMHGMQTRSYDEISVCPSVCPSVRLSVCQTRALWQNGRKICLDFYIIRKNIYPSFLRRMVGGGRPFLPEILGQPARIGAKSLILNR